MVDEMIQNWWDFHHLKSKLQQRRAMDAGLSAKSSELLQQILLPVLGSLTNLHPKYPIYSPLLAHTVILDFAYIYGGRLINLERDECYTVDDYQLAQRRDRFLLLQGWRVIRYQDGDFGSRLSKTIDLTKKVINSSSIDTFSLLEQAIIHYAARSKNTIFRVSEIIKHLNMGRDRLCPILKRLNDQNIILVVGENLKRIHRYQLNMHHAAVQRYFNNY